MSADNEIQFVLSVDSADAHSKLKQTAADFQAMGIESVNAGQKNAAQMDALIAKLQNVGSNHRKVTSDVIDGWKRSGEVISDTGYRVNSSAGGLTNASSAARGLAQELGVSLPRATTRWLSQLEGIGPLLTLAFAPVAIVGMIEALGQLPREYNKLVGALSGWDETAKRAYDDFIKSNIEAGNKVEQLQEKVNASRASQTEGGVARSAAEYDALTKNIRLAEDRSKDLLQVQQRQSLAVADLNTLTHNIGQYVPFLRLYWSDAEEKVEEYKKTLPEITRLTEQYASKLREMNEIDKERLAHQKDLAANAQLLTVRGIADASSATQRSLRSEGLSLGARASMLDDQIAAAGGEGLAQDPFRRIRQQSIEAEERRNADRVQELASHRATATLNIDPEKRGADLKRIDAEEKAETLRHQNELIAINNQSLSAELAAREQFDAQLKAMVQSNADWMRTQLEKEAQDAYSLGTAQLKANGNVLEAQVSADMAAAQRRLAINADLVKHADLTASQQVAKKLDLDLKVLDGERRLADETYRIKADEIEKEIALLQKLIAERQRLGFVTDTQDTQLIGLQGQRGILDVTHSSAAADINDRARKAQEDAAAATRQRQDALVSSISGDISRMFTDRITNANMSFWQSFKKLGQDAIASITRFFLDSLLKGLLSPFKSILDSMVQSIGARLASIFAGRAIGGLGGGPWSEAIPGISGTSGLAGGFGGLLGGTGGLLINNSVAANAMGGTLGLGVAGAGPGISTGIGGALGLGGGAGLFGLGAATIPVLGGIAAGIFGLYKLFHHNKPNYVAGPDPFSQLRDQTYHFNTTFPFEQLTKTLNKVDDTLSGLQDSVNSFNTQDPGVIVKDGYPAIKSDVKATVANGLADDRSFRRSVSGSIVQEPL